VEGFRRRACIVAHHQGDAVQGRHAGIIGGENPALPQKGFGQCRFAREQVASGAFEQRGRAVG
jgi:hypothetical protein